jgi:hypothetical protein
VSLCSGRRASDETAGRVRTSFVRSPQKSTGGQEGKWVMSLARQCGGCYVRDCLSGRKISTAAGLKRQRSTTSERLLCRHAEPPPRGQGVLEKDLSVTRLPFTYQGRWITIILSSVDHRTFHQVVEHVRDSPKVNVFCAVSRSQVYGLLFSPRLHVRVTCASTFWSTPLSHRWM